MAKQVTGEHMRRKKKRSTRCNAKTEKTQKKLTQPGVDFSLFGKFCRTNRIDKTDT